MKKFLLAAAAIFAACSLADAQIYVESQRKSPELIGRFRTGDCSVWISSSGYNIALSTSNRYDDLFIFYIGETKESALETLDDLIEVCSSDEMEETIFSFSTCNGKYVYKAEVVAPLGSKGLWFYKDGYAGSITLWKNELQRAKDLISHYAGDDEKSKQPAVSIVQDTDGTISSAADGTSLVAAADGAYMLRLDSSRQVKIGSSWEEAEAVIKNLYSMFSALNKGETGAVTCGGVQYTVKHKSALGSESLVFVDIDENSGITKEALVQYLKDGRAWSSARQ